MSVVAWVFVPPGKVGFSCDVEVEGEMLPAYDFVEPFLAMHWPERIIKCWLCGERNATWVDGLFPYHWDNNRCEECKHSELVATK